MKRNRKSGAACALLLALLLALCSGCGAEKADGPVEIQVYFTGCNVTYDADVMEELNAYLEETIGVHMKPIWGTWGDFGTNSMMALQGGDDIDIYFTSSWTSDEYNRFAKRGYWLRLDDPENNLLEAYASELLDTLPPALTQGLVADGAQGKGIYAFPSYKGVSQTLCWDVNMEKFTAMGYTAEDLETLDYYTLGPILQRSKEVFGADFYPIVCNVVTMERMVSGLTAVTGSSETPRLFSCFLNTADNSQPNETYGVWIYNKAETPEFERYVHQSREYYLKGYIDPAMGNTNQATSTISSKRTAGDYLFNVVAAGLNSAVQASKDRGYAVEMPVVLGPYVDTTSTQMSLMAVSVYSKHPDKAVALMNLFNTDAKAYTLLSYGLEGVHYVKNTDGLVEFTEQRSRYMPNTGGIGNDMLLPETREQGAGWTEAVMEYERNAAQTPQLGFAFDSAAVETEMGALANVDAEYLISLCAGTVDPDEKLPEYREKLKKAGIEKVVAEANLQLEAYLAF